MSAVQLHKKLLDLWAQDAKRDLPAIENAIEQLKDALNSEVLSDAQTVANMHNKENEPKTNTNLPAKPIVRADERVVVAMEVDSVRTARSPAPKTVQDKTERSPSPAESVSSRSTRTAAERSSRRPSSPSPINTSRISPKTPLKTASDVTPAKTAVAATVTEMKTAKTPTSTLLKRPATSPLQTANEAPSTPLKTARVKSPNKSVKSSRSSKSRKTSPQRGVSLTEAMKTAREARGASVSRSASPAPNMEAVLMSKTVTPLKTAKETPATPMRTARAASPNKSSKSSKSAKTLKTARAAPATPLKTANDKTAKATPVKTALAAPVTPLATAKNAPTDRQKSDLSVSMKSDKEAKKSAPATPVKTAVAAPVTPMKTANEVTLVKTAASAKTPKATTPVKTAVAAPVTPLKTANEATALKTVAAKTPASSFSPAKVAGAPSPGRTVAEEQLALLKKASELSPSRTQRPRSPSPSRSPLAAMKLPYTTLWTGVAPRCPHLVKRITEDMYELSALLAVLKQDMLAFEDSINQVMAFYQSMDAFPASANRHLMMGLNLMFLLASNRLSDFHMLLEQIPQQVQTTNPFISCPVKLEQSLMEGAYNKVVLTEKTIPAPYYAVFTRIMMDTVRNKIAECMEKAFKRVSVKDATQLLLFSAAPETTAFVQKRNWKVSGETIVFETDEAAAAAAKPTLDTDRIAKQAIFYAKQLEMIV